MRSTASKGPYDLMAVGPNDVLLLQVTRMRKPTPTRIRQKLRALAAAAAPEVPCVRKELWIWTDHEGWRIQSAI